MKLIIAGSRDIKDKAYIFTRIGYWISRFENELFEKPITEIVSGMADGVDQIGAAYGNEHGIPVKPFPVTAEDWARNRYGAGHERNGNMADYADLLLAFWSPLSKTNGTFNMVEHMMRARKKEVFVETVLYKPITLFDN